MFSAACDDAKAAVFQCATQAAQKALDSIGRPLPIKVTSGSLGSSGSSFSSVLIEAIRRADDGLNVDRHAFDLVEVTSGPMMGLQAIGIGSNKEKRERACRVAVAVAALTCPDCHSRLCSTVCGDPEDVHVENVDAAPSLMLPSRETPLYNAFLDKLSSTGDEDVMQCLAEFGIFDKLKFKKPYGSAEPPADKTDDPYELGLRTEHLLTVTKTQRSNHIARLASRMFLVCVAGCAALLLVSSAGDTHGVASCFWASIGCAKPSGGSKFLGEACLMICGSVAAVGDSWLPGEPSLMSCGSMAPGGRTGRVTLPGDCR